MRRLVLSLGLTVWATLAPAFEIEDRALFGPEAADQTLRVISTADIAVFRPLIDSFLADTPGVAVDYSAASTTEVMRALETEGASFDVAISSAMDLQTKLVNDGHARAHRSGEAGRLPDWAVWRQHLFAFTEEPASIVLSRAAFEGMELPQTRQALITLLRQHPDRFEGRIGTYDLRRSGLGYLFATQDARTSETFWRLTEVLGSLGTRLYCCSSDMLDDLASGQLAVAYNVLGSYAQARPDAETFEIVLPQDFTTVMLRTALVPQSAEQPDLGGAFIDHLLRAAWSGGRAADYPFARIGEVATEDSLRRIRMGPGLLVYLDDFKKRSFLREWENAILQR